MSSNISDSLPNKSDNPGEKVRKKSGDFDNTKKALVTTTDTVVKEENSDMAYKKKKTEFNVLKEAITPPISENNKIDTVKKQRNHNHPIKH